MATTILFNKPFQVLSQFSPDGDKKTLADFIDIAGIYPTGRLDFDSEGLMLLTDDGKLQATVSDPRYGKAKTYLSQVEGEPSADSVQRLSAGVELKDGLTRRAQIELIAEPDWLWPRNPPIRVRKNIPDSWLELQISEGRNRQVRRMTAAVGHPTLRLIRIKIADWTLDGLQPGEFRFLSQ